MKLQESTAALALVATSLFALVIIIRLMGVSGFLWTLVGVTSAGFVFWLIAKKLG